MAYIKRFSDTEPDEVEREVKLQQLAAEYGLAPSIIDTDNATYITMEHLGPMNLAEVYGDAIEDIPHRIRCEIWDILWALYTCCNIDYVDVTPYNFIQKDGKVWVIDFGHAYSVPRGTLTPWLFEVLSGEHCLSEWNADFA